MSSTKRRTKYAGQSEAKVWPADHPKVDKPKGKKDTKQWCKGKVGVEHERVIVRSNWAHGMRCHPSPPWRLKLRPDYRWTCYHMQICVKCGKVLSHDIGQTECPELPAIAS